VEPTLIATVNVERMMTEFPALWLFGPTTGETLARILGGALEHGVPEECLQELVDGDQFIITVAGSVYCQIQHNDSFGCDGGRDDGEVPESTKED
jgi:hypothetical protein